VDTTWAEPTDGYAAAHTVVSIGVIEAGTDVIAARILESPAHKGIEIATRHHHRQWVFLTTSEVLFGFISLRSYLYVFALCRNGTKNSLVSIDYGNHGSPGPGLGIS
jgi:hypothetical protein